MSLNLKHTHKFKRHRYKSGNEVYFCALPDCSVKIAPALALGKRTICWRCENEFVMTEYSVRLAKPHCLDCHKPKSKVGSLSISTTSTTSLSLPSLSLPSTEFKNPFAHEEVIEEEEI
jgi:hypothetical protein